MMQITPSRMVDTVLRLIPERSLPERVLDVGAGTGAWGDAVLRRWQDAEVTGVEVLPEDINPIPDCYTEWVCADYLGTDFPMVYDLVVGTPPYPRKEYANAVVSNGLNLVRLGGYVIHLYPLEYMAEVQMRSMTYTRLTPKVVVTNVRPLRREPEGEGYAAYVWQSGYVGSTKLGYFDYATGEIGL